MRNQNRSSFLPIATIFLSGLAALSLASCNGGDGDGPSGKSTIQGNVSGFSGTVTLRGTKQVARPASDGLFVFSGVEAGSRTLDFTQSVAIGLAAGETASLTLNVPDDSTVKLGRVTIAGKTAKAGGVQIIRNKTEKAGDDPANHDANDDRVTGKDDDGPNHDVGDDKGGGTDDGPDHDVGDDKGAGDDDGPDHDSGRDRK